MAAELDGGHGLGLDLLCENFGDFQQVLKSMRIVDDRITYALNTAIPTDSFASAGDPQGLQQCRKLSEELQLSHRQREQTIRTCIDFTGKRIQDLKAAVSNVESSKEIRKEQSKLRMMLSELNVEEVLRDRATKILHDRCKFFVRKM